MLAGVLTTVAFVPQVLRTRQTGSARDFSLKMLLLFVTGVGLVAGVWAADAVHADGGGEHGDAGACVLHPGGEAAAGVMRPALTRDDRESPGCVHSAPRMS